MSILGKFAARGAGTLLPQRYEHALERWRRGRRDFRRLQKADCAVVSYGKSGRTWLRVMISRYLQQQYDLPENLLLGFDNYHLRNRAAPRVFFTHDSYLRHYTGHLGTREDFYDKRTVLLVRRPQDVAVSQYHQWKHRMRSHKKALNDYPSHGADISLFDFVQHEGAGLPKIVGFMNAWARELSRMKEVHVVRYEDLRAEPVAELSRVMEFMTGALRVDWVEEAVRFGSVDSMRAMEQGRFFGRRSSRVQARDPKNPDSHKVRRARSGGYREDFDAEQLAVLDAYVQEHLDPAFGYGDETA